MPQRAAVTIFLHVTSATTLEGNDGTFGRPRHPLRLVAAARRQRARRRARRELRARGHSVTVLAPSNRARDLAAGPPRARHRRSSADLVALGPAVPISRRSRMGVPVGVRANLAVALAHGGFDVVHGFEPGLPSLSYLALRDAAALTVGDVLLARAAVLPARAHASRTAARPARRAARDERGDGGGRGRALPRPLRARAARRRPRALRTGAEAQARRARVAADGASAPARARRASSPRSRTGSSCCCAPGRSRRARRCPVRSAAACACAPRSTAPPRRRAARRGRLRAGGRRRAARRARGSGRRRRGRLAGGPAAPAGARRRRGGPADRGRRVPRRAAPRKARGGAHPELRRARRPASSRSTRIDRRRRRAARAAPPLEDRDWILVDLHMHTTWSHDCSIEVDDLLDHAEAEGLGAIAITDHNVFGGALEAVEKARGRKLIVIPGEEVKTDGQGEVIGLFLKEEIPRGHVVRRDGGGDPRAGRPRLHPASLRPAARDPGRRDAAAPPRRRSTSSRSTTRACSSRATTTRRSASRGSTTSPQGCRIGRARAPGRRHGRRSHAALPGPGGVPALAAKRRDFAAPEVACVPPGAQVGGPGQGKGSLEANQP